MAANAHKNALLRMHVFASGSKGNATVIEDTDTGRSLLVDCGICKRDFFARCEEVGINPLSIESILITHEHTDHTKGLGVVLRGLAKLGHHPDIYVSDAIKNASVALSDVEKLCDIKKLGGLDQLNVAGVEVLAFPTSHDSSESYGFRFSRSPSDVIGYVTDTGIMTALAFEALQDCRILALESNHDKRMLETGPYPYIIKQRVASDKGHLSNAQAADVLENLLCNNLEQVIAMHISENNNTYKLPVDSLKAVIAKNSHLAKVRAAYQLRCVSV